MSCMHKQLSKIKDHNKQNIVINKQHQYSFRQLNNNNVPRKSEKTIDHQYSNKNIEQYFRVKTQSQKPSLKVSRRKYQNQTFHLTQALRMENDSLKTTLHLAKDHNIYLENAINKYKKQLKKQQKIIKKQQQQLNMCQKQINKMTKKVEQYDTLLPKLTELEHLQNGIIYENQILKEQKYGYKSILKNIKTLVTKDKNCSFDKILMLLEALQIKQTKIESQNTKNK